MADLIASGNSPEAVAYALLFGIALNEGKTGAHAGVTVVKADEQWVLETYRRCLSAARGIAE